MTKIGSATVRVNGAFGVEVERKKNNKNVLERKVRQT
jgi:hypothetical protein